MNNETCRTNQRGLPSIACLLVFPIILVASDGALWSQEAARDASLSPLVAGGAATFQYHASDDLAAWTAMEVLISEGGDAKRWIEAAAGSTPWEDRTPGLWVKGRRPGPRGELVGYSRLEGDGDDAVRGARESAIRQIAAMVIWSVRDRLGKPGLVAFEDLARLAEAETRKALGAARVDGFEQSVDRPYGRLYRAAVLVRVGPKSLRKIGVKLEKELERAEARARVERRVLVWKGGIAAVLAVLAVVGYLGLNALTKGFFTWRLRALSLLGLGAAYAILVWIRV